MTTFAFTLDVTVQADDGAEARELRDQAAAAVATDPELHSSVLSVVVDGPGEVRDRRVTA